MHTLPSILTRSLLAAGAGCMLTVCTLSAQENKATPPTSADGVSGDQNRSVTDRLHTDSTVPRKAASEKATRELTNKEKQFINMALASNTSEIMMAELVLGKTDAAGVKEYAQNMVSDHKKANEMLSTIDSAHGANVPSPNPTGEAKANYAKLTSLTGTALDTSYLKQAVADHKMDIKEYKAAKADVQDKMLMSYIDKTLAAMEEHLQMAEMLEKKTGSAR